MAMAYRIDGISDGHTRGPHSRLMAPGRMSDKDAADTTSPGNSPGRRSARPAYDRCRTANARTGIALRPTERPPDATPFRPTARSAEECRFDRFAAKQKPEPQRRLRFSILRTDDYIMPPIPPAGIAGMAGASDFFSASTHSVVRNIEAIEAAFSNATRETLVGSMIPALSRSS